MGIAAILTIANNTGTLIGVGMAGLELAMKIKDALKASPDKVSIQVLENGIIKSADETLALIESWRAQNS